MIIKLKYSLRRKKDKKGVPVGRMSRYWKQQFYDCFWSW